jgi:hypothetical protein
MAYTVTRRNILFWNICKYVLKRCVMEPVHCSETVTGKYIVKFRLGIYIVRRNTCLIIQSNIWNNFPSFPLFCSGCQGSKFELVRTFQNNQVTICMLCFITRKTGQHQRVKVAACGMTAAVPTSQNKALWSVRISASQSKIFILWHRDSNRHPHVFFLVNLGK